MPVINPQSQLHRDMIAWRHDLHRHPELGLQEQRTSAMVQAALRRFGVDEVIIGLAGTGVVGVIHGHRPGRAIGLRADMDALPIREETGLAHASCTEGVCMPAAMTATRRCCWGPRTISPRRGISTAGLCDLSARRGGVWRRRFDDPRRPVRTLSDGGGPRPAQLAGASGRLLRLAAGPITAGAAKLKIAILGRGCHSAFPHLGVDPIVVASNVVCSLQTIVSRVVDPVESGVVTIAQMTAGSACNVIPDLATMQGTLRWSRPSVGELLETEVRRIATGIAAGLGAVADVTIEPVMPATINDPAFAELSCRAAVAVAGETRVQRLETPSLAGEDFAFMLNALPGNYILLGSGQSATPVHSAKYDFNDDILPVGASYWVTLAEQSLRPNPGSAT